ncbi:hypothetical protein OQA88_12782 [Cercophora sp. LCS_1]
MTGTPPIDLTADQTPAHSSNKHTSSSSILFQNPTKTVIVLDLPRSLEESQVPSRQLNPHVDPPRRLVSAPPPTTPFPTPEPKKHPASAVVTSHAAQIAELMTFATIESALAELHESYTGPFSLQRISRAPSQASSSHPLIPEDSQPLNGRIEDLRSEVLELLPFDLILLDPPWPNRSAKRKRGYQLSHSFSCLHTLLSQVPISSHLAPDGLVAVWITNSPQAYDLLVSRDGLFAEWDVEPVGEWVWLKVTDQGEPIVSLEATWRKPWERLVFGRKRGGSGGAVKTKVIVACPEGHSRKPCLRGLLEEEDMGERVLEVFARGLTAGWSCWGDEALKFQSAGWWVDERPDKSKSEDPETRKSKSP